MNELHQKILDAARDEVAKKYGYASWHHVEGACRTTAEIMVIYKEASLLAMDRQAEFYRHISGEGWLHEKDETWYKPHDDSYKTELELYNIWREGQRNEG